jgi:endonuclease/exonuclease/phosphatase family metal-dependent hydrolase
MNEFTRHTRFLQSSICTVLSVSLSSSTLAASLPTAFRPAPDDLPAAVRVMTWNGQTQYHDADEWARVVGNQAPDIVGMQEVCVREIKELRNRLKDDYGLDYYVSYGSVRTSRDPGCGSIPWLTTGAWGQALLIRTSLGLPLNAETTKYQQCGRGDPVCPRGYQAITVTLPGGVQARIFNTHIGFGGTAPGAQVKELATAANRYTHAIILGDMNLKPDRQELAPLRRDFREMDPLGHFFTFPNDPEDKNKQPTEKIDYIFFRGLVKTSSAPETYWTKSSYHRPLIGHLRAW